MNVRYSERLTLVGQPHCGVGVRQPLPEQPFKAIAYDKLLCNGQYLLRRPGYIVGMWTDRWIQLNHEMVFDLKVQKAARDCLVPCLLLPNQEATAQSSEAPSRGQRSRIVGQCGTGRSGLLIGTEGDLPAAARSLRLPGDRGEGNHGRLPCRRHARQDRRRDGQVHRQRRSVRRRQMRPRLSRVRREEGRPGR